MLHSAARGLQTALKAQARHAGYPAFWQPSDGNVGERYGQPITHRLPDHWKRAKNRDPEPTALTNAKASSRFDLDYNFPDFSITLEIHSVLYPTTLVVFRTPPQLSESEIKNYLENMYGINTIQEINLQYRRGDRWMDQFGRRWKHPDYMRCYVYLSKPVHIQVKAKQD
ncbi:hypothetical protein DIPPA_18072 [Diplonema papillatum]|nr:hypothetical protein DIPPA_18072 [Diplonema papillatum]